MIEYASNILELAAEKTINKAADDAISKAISNNSYNNPLIVLPHEIKADASVRAILSKTVNSLDHADCTLNKTLCEIKTDSIINDALTNAIYKGILEEHNTYIKTLKKDIRNLKRRCRYRINLAKIDMEKKFIIRNRRKQLYMKKKNKLIHNEMKI